MGKLFGPIIKLGRRLWLWVLAWLADKGWTAAVAVSIQAAVLVAWGVFWGLFFNEVDKLNLAGTLLSNPLAHAPAGAVYLLNTCFPTDFALNLLMGYLVFKFTLAHAAYIMSRTVKFLMDG